MLIIWGIITISLKLILSAKFFASVFLVIFSEDSELKKYVSDKKGHEGTEEIINNLLRIGESIGDVMEETRKALNDDNVDESEKEKIALQVKNIEKKIAELKFKLDLGEKTDYSKVQRRE